MTAIPCRAGDVRTAAEDDLVGRGFRSFTTAHSKGHRFVIWLRPPALAGRTAWKAAVLSRGTVSYATAYVATDGVLRASVPIEEPAGHLLFRAGTRQGEPFAGNGFQCKFGAAQF